MNEFGSEEGGHRKGYCFVDGWREEYVEIRRRVKTLSDATKKTIQVGGSLLTTI